VSDLIGGYTAYAEASRTASSAEQPVVP
jgi:hypothetical protein